MAVVKNKSTPEMRKFWEHVEAVAPQVTAPEPQVTAERVKSYRHQLLRRDDATETAALSSWSDAEVAAFASSLLAERDRTIAELEAGYVRRGQLATEAQLLANASKQRAAQAEQERDAREKDLCRTVNILQSISHPSGVSRFEDAMHAIRELQDCYLTAKGKTNRLEATAERLRGLLREWYLHYLNNGEWDELPLALRQRIQKELEP